MASEGGGGLSFSMASVVEDVLQQHGVRSRDLDLDSRRAEEAGNFTLTFHLCACVCFIMYYLKFD